MKSQVGKSPPWPSGMRSQYKPVTSDAPIQLDGTSDYCDRLARFIGHQSSGLVGTDIHIYLTITLQNGIININVKVKETPIKT